MFSQDGAWWLYADAFGVTRVGLDAHPKVGKHTMKAACGPRGALSLTRRGDLAMVAPGRYQTQSGGFAGRATLALPAAELGLRARQEEPAGLMTPGDEDRVLTLEGAQLLLHTLTADTLAAERAVALEVAPQLGDLAIGPHEAPDALNAQPLLVVAPDGRYVALMSNFIYHMTPTGAAWQVAPRRLYAGKIGADAQADAAWWQAALVSSTTADTSLALVGEDVWVTVMDHTTDTAHIAHITRDGAVTTHALPALAPPAFTATHLLYQPSSGEVRRRELATGAEDTFDVGHHNAHPQPEHGDEVYKGSPRPAPPTRLPGHLAANERHMFFVPWHGELIVNLASDAAYARGLRPAPGAYRRLVSTLIAQHNQSLRQLNCQLRLDGFDHNAANASSSKALAMPWLPDQLVSAAASAVLSGFVERYDLAAGGWRGGSLSLVGGLAHLTALTDAAQARAALDWMRGAGLTPLDALRPLTQAYRRSCGFVVLSSLPSFVGDGAPRPMREDAERLYLRAMLETIRLGGWPQGRIPASWADEPITPQLARDAAGALITCPRPLSSDAADQLTMMLTAHLGDAAIPALLRLLELSQRVRCGLGQHVGARLVWLCSQLPHIDRAQLAAAVSAISVSPQPNTYDQLGYDKRLILDALAALG
jgi:hypothetical protein